MSRCRRADRTKIVPLRDVSGANVKIKGRDKLEVLMGVLNGGGD